MKYIKDNKKKKILVLILIFIIILCVLFRITQSKNLNFQEDLIFFKIFNIEDIQENSNKKNTYEIEVIKGRKNFQKIKLFQSVDMDTLINKKIAPGTKGNFYVFLTSNANVEYEIKIINKNRSPENFEFNINEREGKIKKGEVKRIEIGWEWPYEISEKKNVQDTKDGKEIEEYDFEICTIGK